MGKFRAIALIASSFFLLNSCIGGPSTTEQESIQKEKLSQKDLDKLSTAYFASGCFWCVEAVYESVKGVKEVVNGYSGGHTENPTYESSNTGTTGHAEAVAVYYDPSEVDFATLVKVYYGSQDPTTVNGQGPDFGSQYRSILFYSTDSEKKIIEEYMAIVSKEYSKPLATEIQEFKKFWVGEDYHQDYERLHPNHGYIRNVSVPRLNRFQEKFPELIKAKH